MAQPRLLHRRGERYPLAHGFGSVGVGQQVDLHLVDAAPNATSWLVLSTQSAPMQLLGGTLVPGLPALIVPFLTDGAGQVSTSTVVTAAPPPGSSVYLQWLTGDPAAPFGLSFSNALRVDA